ncbi:2-dehydropantoate 2-reductase [Streptomyces boncukensis]|uniref:2-dehydropantoate 2-reductase n=1 Tax=Streptomyces boncukensis TaxID=2711219 RepID=A0A6G4WSV8_9ACTN|nr:2-dehydropantoate 2-reductase [Streptomyces boncukensis]NGO68083.1 2-dehydropantoate 2-reductase [Streptomyces boncukensis]
MTQLRVAVFGAGSIGCYLGGHLAAAGTADVTLVGRPAVLDAARERGLTLSTSDAPDVRVKPHELRTATDAAAVRDAVGAAECVLVTVKSAGTARAAEELRLLLRPGTVVASFQNGLRNPGVLRDGLPGHTVLTGMVPYNVLGVGPGTYHRGVGGELVLDDDPRGAPLVAALRGAGLETATRPDMAAVQYAKLLLNLNNAVNALSGLTLLEELGQRAYRECLARCQQEALAAFRAGGMEPAQLGPAGPDFVIEVLRLPDAEYAQLAGEALRIDATARSSMWEDLERGRATEIADLQGEVVALAARHGLAAPANARIAELVRQAERDGAARHRWTGPELLAELDRE